MSTNNIGLEHFGFVLRPVAQGFDPTIARIGTTGGCSICHLLKYDAASKIISLSLDKDPSIRVKESWVVVEAGGQQIGYDVEQAALKELNARRLVSLILPPNLGSVSAIRLVTWRVSSAEPRVDIVL